MKYKVRMIVKKGWENSWSYWSVYYVAKEE